MNGLGKIYAIERKLADEIRSYVLSGRNSWRRVPFLALQADGRCGFSGTYQRAYYSGLWSPSCIPNEYGYGIFVDCATGEIVGSNCNPVGYRVVLSLLNCLDQLDAVKIIQKLQEEVSKGVPSWINKKELDGRIRWREELAKELRLSPLYVRSKKYIKKR